MAAVQDLVISDVQQRKLLFVLHSDGTFRVWDLLSRGKIFGHAMTVPTSTGKYHIPDLLLLRSTVLKFSDRVSYCYNGFC